MFAGAGSNLPDNFADDPAFFERVPVLRVFEDTLHRAMRTHKTAYKTEGRFYCAEAGTYRGRGLRAMLDVAARIGVNVFIYGLDSYEGFPDISAYDRTHAPAGSAYLSKRLFADTSEREVRAYVGEGHEGKFEIVKGFFSDTLSALAERRFLFAVIDCDLYSSHLDCMSYFYDRLMPGGIMFFDDYHSKQYPMAKTAIDEFLASRPEKLLHVAYALPKGNNLKTYIVKR
jgi:O-methyltransferase